MILCDYKFRGPKIELSRTDLGGFRKINDYVDDKVRCLSESDRDFRSIFDLMCREKENIFCERLNGYSIVKTTYAQFRERTQQAAGRLKALLSSYKGEMVGLYMQNSEQWLETFWGLLMIGCKPLLLNTRMSQPLLMEVLADYKIGAVVCDRDLSQTFSCRTIIAQEMFEDGDTAPLSDEDWANEIVLMTSGTSLKVKLCVYTGENMYYQIMDSARIIRESKRMKRHYKGALKQLVFLPLYHIFGLVAVFMWFAYFSRTLVFMRDYSPSTILNTVRRHEVTHIFAVPVLWNRIYEEVIREVRRRDDGSYEKLMRGISLSEKLSGIPGISFLFDRVAFRKVREEIFGNSVQFAISGGSVITGEVLRLFNAVGYHLADGYGMTEIGITSVVLSEKRKALTDGNVGLPLTSVQYRIADSGELLVRGKTIATAVYRAGEPVLKDEEDWFHTGDRAVKNENGYVILGRMDDVVIGQDGENLNPDQLEHQLDLTGSPAWCITKMDREGQDVPVLVIQTPSYATREEIDRLNARAREELARIGLDRSISRVILTDEVLIGEEDFKVNRTMISKKLNEGTLHEADLKQETGEMDTLMQQIAGIFASVLKRDDPVGPDDHPILDLGGTSLDYFTVIMEVQKTFGVTVPQDGSGLSTVRQIAGFIRSKGDAA